MLISWKYNFLFLHIPKTGGTAMTRALAPYARIKDRIAYIGSATPVVRRLLVQFLNGDHIKRITGYDVHTPLFQLEQTLGRECIEPMIKAAFVRNPYSRAYSLYAHIKRNQTHPLHKKVELLSFQDYALFLAEKKREQQLRSVSFSNRNEIALDFIGRFETLAADALRLGNALGLPRELQPQTINANPEPRSELRALFGDAREAFAEAFRLDFELFGYSTDIERAHDAPEDALAAMKQ